VTKARKKDEGATLDRGRGTRALLVSGRAEKKSQKVGWLRHTAAQRMRQVSEEAQRPKVGEEVS
jgi:hypothetical protein